MNGFTPSMEKVMGIGTDYANQVLAAKKKKESDGKDMLGDLRKLGRQKEKKGGRGSKGADKNASKAVSQALRYIGKLEKGPAQELTMAMRKAISKVKLYRLDRRVQSQLARKAPQEYAEALRDMLAEVLQKGQPSPALGNFARPAFNYMVKTNSRMLTNTVGKQLFTKQPKKEKEPKEEPAPKPKKEGKKKKDVKTKKDKKPKKIKDDGKAPPAKAQPKPDTKRKSRKKDKGGEPQPSAKDERAERQRRMREGK